MCFIRLTSRLCCMLLLLRIRCLCRMPKSYVDRMQTLQGSQLSLRKRRMGGDAAQHAERTEQLPGLQHPSPGSHVSGPEQLRDSLARLEQLEDRELRRPQAHKSNPFQHESDAASELGEAASSLVGIKEILPADGQDSCQPGTEQASTHLPAMPTANCSSVSADSYSSEAGTTPERSYGRPPECDINRVPWAQGIPADPSHAGTSGKRIADIQTENRSESIPGAPSGQVLNAERQMQPTISDASSKRALHAEGQTLPTIRKKK